MKYRYNMMLASLLAGLAFSNASLGIVHAMAHSLGGGFDLAHGVCNAILLEGAVDYNYPHAQKKYDELAAAMGVDISCKTDNIKQLLLDRLKDLRIKLGITTKLSGMGIKSHNVPGLSRFVLADPCILTNPVMPTQNDIERLYERLL
ncbi:hypothetical protein [Desulfamplus magnetovallimortis]|uniref:hypothetical protein n=1 Tax=Desulfamplus magnetovallimortis TaxID=1246637 RepID=UPI0026BB7426